MLSRVVITVLVFMGCGCDLVLENLRQRGIRYQIETVDRELGLAELRLDSGRRHLQRVVVDACFGSDPDLQLRPEATAYRSLAVPSSTLLVQLGDRGAR